MVRLLDERASDAYAHRWWVDTTLADALRDAAQRTPERVLVVDGDHRLDCQTLHARAKTLAGHLLDRMPTGSVVSFMLPNWHEAAVIYLAATLAGMVVNPILPSLRDHELRFILADVDSRMIFVPSSFGGHDYLAMLDRVRGELTAPPDVVVVRGQPDGRDALTALLAQTADRAELPTSDPDAEHMILYTSGTTGRSKGVRHSHNSIHALICQIGDHWLVEPGDVFLVPSPIGHIGGSIYAFECPLLLGATAVLMDRWNADNAVALMRRHRCTHIAGATPFLEQILAAAQRAGTRLPDLKVFICGGASVPPALIRRAAGDFRRAVVTRVYGSTEVPLTTVGTLDPAKADQAADTDGRVGIAEVKIDPTGEIWVRGPQMLLGYRHREDDCIDSDGFFRTGDLGRWVDENHLAVTGRTKDLIIRNGENIAPREIEELLLTHPGVAEIAVVGLSDPRTGERVCAVIVPTEPPGPDLAGVRTFLEQHGVARFKVPEQVVSWAALPRSDAGKVLKHQITATLEAGECR